jgi:Protein of unknown function (DUF3575)
MKKILLLTLIMTSLACIVHAQQTEDLQRKNTIKLEVLSSMLYSNAYLLSYERVTKPNQSFSVTGGYQEFPKLTSLGSNIKALNGLSKSGYKVGGEYRFYLQKENKYRAPRGVYLGPYLTYHDFRNKRLIEVDNNGVPEEATLKTSFSILNIGAQLGYQFVIGNRWTIDLILIGPSVSNYKAKIKLDGDFTFDIEDVQNEILLKLIEEFPLLEDVLTDKEATTSGRLDSWSFGYRYQVLLGYHFGRKKK